MISLRPYQTEAVKAAESGGAVVLPTGSGKMIVAAALIRQFDMQTIFLAHRDELLQQAIEKIGMVAPELSSRIGLVKAGTKQWNRQIVVASVQTVSRGNVPDAADRGLVIVDEVHHATEPTYRRVLDQMPGAIRVGFTATPDRTDGKPLVGDGRPFSKIVYRKGIIEMIQAGYLCDIRSVRVGLAGLDLDSVKKVRGDYAEGDLGLAMSGAGAWKRAAEAYLEHAAGRKAIVFTPTVATAEETLKEFAAAGVKAAVVTGETDLEERREILKAFKAGKLSALINCQVLTEGYDEPSVDCIIFARPTRSKLLYTQCLGRGTRIFPGKSDCLVLDLVGAGGLADPMQQTLSKNLGLSEASAAKGVEAVLAELVREGKPIGTGATFDRRGLHWITDGSRYLLSCGAETLLLAPHDLEWQISRIAKGQAGVQPMFSGLTLEYAQGIAEDYARNAGALALASDNSAWRARPASDSQRLTLMKMGGWRDGMTCGEASDAITVVVVAWQEKKRRRA